MATIIVEDGTIVPSANSYATVAEFTQFCSDRNITIVSTYGDEAVSYTHLTLPTKRIV